LLVAAFAAGFVARAVGLPPLVGYLVAGFLLHWLGYETSKTIDAVAQLGVLLLLFGIGLKLKLRTLARPHVWGTASAFALLATTLIAASLLALGAMGLPLAADLDLRTAALLGFALSFSSTVFAVKALERTNESGSLAGRAAVGVLILQDILAVAFLVATSGGWPSPWALALVPGFLLVRPVAGWVLDRSGHGEILLLLGLTLTVAVGAASFQLVGLKPALGALAAGWMLSAHPRAGELADRLLGLKDLLLVGFFIAIGLEGTPPASAWILGAVLLAALPLRAAVLFLLFTRFRLRARTAVHAALTLSTHSEFGLIVGAAALTAGLVDQAWVSTLAVAVAASYAVASAANAFRYRIYDRWGSALARVERLPPLEEDAVIDCGRARILIFGMGRVGSGAYDEVVERRGSIVVGVDRDDQTVARQQRAGRKVIRGDALDRDFWERARFHSEVELVVASTNNHAANLELVSRTRRFLPAARIAAIATYADQVDELREAGVDVARNLYEEAGQGLADDAVGAVFEGSGDRGAMARASSPRTPPDETLAPVRDGTEHPDRGSVHPKRDDRRSRS
jgi:predicted Kef-type K+ transport protein